MKRQPLFGEWIHERRNRLGLTLRAFAIAARVDPGNLSKYERGLLSPPQERQTLRRIAKALGLKLDLDDYQYFMDLAAASAGKIPGDICSDREALKRMPLLFKTARGKATRAELKRLYERMPRV